MTNEDRLVVSPAQGKGRQPSLCGCCTVRSSLSPQALSACNTEMSWVLLSARQTDRDDTDSKWAIAQWPQVMAGQEGIPRSPGCTLVNLTKRWFKGKLGSSESWLGEGRLVPSTHPHSSQATL